MFSRCVQSSVFREQAWTPPFSFRKVYPDAGNEFARVLPFLFLRTRACSLENDSFERKKKREKEEGQNKEKETKSVVRRANRVILVGYSQRNSRISLKSGSFDGSVNRFCRHYPLSFPLRFFESYLLALGGGKRTSIGRRRKLVESRNPCAI